MADSCCFLKKRFKTAYLPLSVTLTQVFSSLASFHKCAKFGTFAVSTLISCWPKLFRRFRSYEEHSAKRKPRFLASWRSCFPRAVTVSKLFLQLHSPRSRFKQELTHEGKESLIWEDKRSGEEEPVCFFCIVRYTKQCQNLLEQKMTLSFFQLCHLV